MLKRVLVTGSSGYIAKSFITHNQTKYHIDTISRSSIDLTNLDQVSNFLKNKYYDVVLHTATAGGSRLKEDTKDVVYTNLLMFENLKRNKKSFKKFINLGSGAEIYYPQTPYGLSKRIIHEIIKHEQYFYNLRIFAVFDENELDSRFIKNNILNSLKHAPIVIHKNRLFDFFYMGDLLSVINHYIDNDIDKKYQTYNCTYKEKFSLYEVAEKILKYYPDGVIEKNKEGLDIDYIGEYVNLPELPSLIGLDAGIEKVFNFLKEKYVENKIG